MEQMTDDETLLLSIATFGFYNKDDGSTLCVVRGVRSLEYGIGWTKQRMTETITRLELDGFVETEKKPNGDYSYIWYTDKGKQKFTELRKTVTQ